jgi:uncharacterized protein YciU (UPF0263 family)
MLYMIIDEPPVIVNPRRSDMVDQSYRILEQMRYDNVSPYDIKLFVTLEENICKNSNTIKEWFPQYNFDYHDNVKCS